MGDPRTMLMHSKRSGASGALAGRRGRRSILSTAAAAAVVGGLLVGPALVTPPPAMASAAISGVVNTYQAVSAVAGNTVTVTGSTRGASTPFAVGDRVMLIQMTGLAPAVAGSTFGNYDIATITAVSGSQVTLSSIAHSYSPGSEAVQLVRTFADTGTVTVSGTVTAAPWDGSTGGVVSVTADQLVLNSDIDATGTGFTKAHAPTGATSASQTTGAGAAEGRGFPGGTFDQAFTSLPGGPGGGLGGGGGVTGAEGEGEGGGHAGGGDPGGSSSTTGTDGGAAEPAVSGAVGWLGTVVGGGSAGGAGGGGGVIGGGGGGGSATGGGGGGTDGGGAGGEIRRFEPNPNHNGAGGGGSLGVGNGGDGVTGGPTGTSSTTSANEGSAGGGGGSYGGGGGAASNISGGDDSAGGGGGGSWLGGGQGGPGGDFGTSAYPAGGDGNAAVATPIPDSAHYLNAANPRLMMGGGGGRAGYDAGLNDGGAGGGIVYVDAVNISGPGAISSEGEDGRSPAGGGAHSGSGAGAGGQMRIRAVTISSPITLDVTGGTGGAPTANNFHAGVSGGGGGGGGVWLELAGASTDCPTAGIDNVTFATDGGHAGNSITNPKNAKAAGRAGDGGAGLACTSPRVDNPRLTLDKRVASITDVNDNGITDAGDTIHYEFEVANTGNVTLTDVTVDDALLADADVTVTCAPSTLAPGESVICTASTGYVITQADVDAGRVENTATARGTSPHGGPTVTTPPDTTVTPVEPPATSKAQPTLTTVTSAAVVAPGAALADKVTIAGLNADYAGTGSATLYGPFSSRAEASCTTAKAIRTVAFTPRNGLQRTPSVTVTRPGYYTWIARISADATHNGATHGCGLVQETTLNRKTPLSSPPTVDTGYVGTVRNGRIARTTTVGTISYPAIGATGVPVSTAGLRDGKMVVPPSAQRVGVLNRTAAAGDAIGSVVVAGHVSDRYNRPGALFRLSGAQVGQVITYRTAAGKTVRYRVVSKQFYRRGAIPLSAFSTTSGPRMTLISCAGIRWSGSRFHYTKNVVVIAKQIR